MVNIPVFIHKFIFILCCDELSIILIWITQSSPPLLLFSIYNLRLPANRSLIHSERKKKNCFLFIFIVIINLIDVVSKNFRPCHLPMLLVALFVGMSFISLFKRCHTLSLPPSLSLSLSLSLSVCGCEILHNLKILWLQNHILFCVFVSGTLFTQITWIYLDGLVVKTGGKYQLDIYLWRNL